MSFIIFFYICMRHYKQEVRETFMKAQGVLAQRNVTGHWSIVS